MDINGVTIHDVNVKLYYIGRKRVTGIFYQKYKKEVKKNIMRNTKLELIREINKYDKNAVAVYYNNYCTQEKIGYISKESNVDIAYLLNNKMYCYALVHELDISCTTPAMTVDVYMECTPAEYAHLMDKAL